MVSLPKASVFIPTYNRAHYLPQCLDSILAQTYQDFEIVIVDDGSADDSHELLLDYQGRFPAKIHYHWHPGHANKGVAATSNLAILKSRGEYLAWTGSDDVWYPEKLELQIAQLEHDPRLGMVYSYADFIDGDGRLLPGRARLDITSDPNPVGRILQYCHPPAMTTVIRRNCLEKVGLCDETLQTCEDWDLWIRVFSHWKAGFIDRPLAQYRLHSNNLSKRIDPKLDLRRILSMYRHLEQKQSDIGGALLTARNQAILDLQVAFHLFCDDELEEAVKRLHSAFQKDPSLCDDVAFFNAWLNDWKPGFYTPEHNHFGLWAIAHLPPTSSRTFRKRLVELQLAQQETRSFFVRRGTQQGLAQSTPGPLTTIFEDCPDRITLPQAWKAQVLKEIYAALLFETFNAHELPKARYYWAKAVQYKPAWLLNRGVWSIGLRALMAPRAT